MLIALFALLTSLLFGGGESPYILPKAEKLVKKHVQDKARQKEALDLMKAYKNDWKSLKKLEKKSSKQIAKLNKDRNTSHEVLVEAFESAKEQRNSFQEKLIDARYQIQGILTGEEWEIIMTESVETRQKKAKKIEKSDAKAMIQQDKMITKLGDDILAAFDDPQAKKKASEDLDMFGEALVNLLVEYQNYPSAVIESIKNGNATREEIAEVVYELESFRGNLHDSYLEMRKELVELSTEDNWPKLAKALAKFF